MKRLTRPGIHRRRIGAREANLWALVVAAVAYWANIVRDSGAGDAGLVVSGITNISGNGAFDVFAWAMAFAVTAKTADDSPASRGRLCAVVLAGSIVLLPLRAASAAALVAISPLFFTDRRLRGVGFLLLALALETFWLSALLAPLHVLVGRGDARICAALLRLLGSDVSAHVNFVENASTDFAIAIWPYCTSTLPLAGVSLAFLVMVLYRGRTPRIADLPLLGMAFVASVLLTEIRLVLLATSAANYSWWHDGPGVTIYALAALGSAVLFPLLATRDAAERPARPTARQVA